MLANFATTFDRDLFVRQLEKVAPDVFGLARPSVVQPTTVSFRGLTEGQEVWLTDRIASFKGAKAFPNVRFRTMQGA